MTSTLRWFRRNTCRARRRRSIHVVRALAECADHAADRFVEHQSAGSLKQSTAEFEINEEINLAALCVRQEFPLVVQVAERPVLVAHLDPPRPVERDTTGEGFPERSEADCEIGHQFTLGAALHPRAGTPREELRV